MRLSTLANDCRVVVCSIVSLLQIISIMFGLVSPYPPLWEKASDVYRQIMEAGYNNAIMSFLEIECLTRRHSIRAVQHVPSFQKRNSGITPLVKGRMLITFSQHFADLIDLKTRLLCA